MTDTNHTPPCRDRRRGGGRRKARASSAEMRAAPYIQRNIPLFGLAGEETLQKIERNADRILAETGIIFTEYPKALELFRTAGAKVVGERVYFPEGMAREIISNSAPSQFTQHARNAERSVEIGGNNMVLVPAYGPPFVFDIEKGRRYATLEDFQNFVKLTYQSPSLHHSGGTVCEPVDIAVNKRHLDMLYSHIRYSDKAFMGSVTAPERAEDCVELAKILFGADFVNENCVLINLINANSPMVFDATMLAAADVYARNNQACVVSPFILAGAMSPVTVMGTCAQILAEAMAGMAFTQLVRPGAPVVFGTFASSISMQSGAPTFGTPEPSLVLNVCAALARRLNVPFRSGGGLCASKLPDAQAAYESANTLNAAANAGVNFMLHTTGWLEGGLVMGYEKFIMDADQAGMLGVYLGGINTSEGTEALEAIHEVGMRSVEEGRHFLGVSHTQRFFESAFYRSEVADNNSFEQWESEGSLDAAQRANQLMKRRLDEYEAPSLDEGVDEALKAYISEKKATVPDLNT